MQDKFKFLSKKIFKSSFPYLFISFLLLGILYFAYLYFLKDKPQRKPEYIYDFKIRPHSNIPEYLKLENLEYIDKMPVREYVQSLFVKFYPLSRKDALPLAKQEIEKRFFGEKSMVLITLLELYSDWLDELDNLREDENLDGYTRKKLSLEKRKQIFGIELENYLFPNSDFDKIELFFLYAKRYIKKHREDEISEIRDHLYKAKQEIYEEDYERLIQMESFDKQLELELLLQEREISILNEEERKLRIQKIRSEIYSRQ